MPSRGPVLLVNGFDDRDLYAEHFRANDLLVYNAATPEHALAQMERAEPALVVTDFVFQQSALDGPAFIRELRARLDDAVSIIVVSGFAREEDRAAARAAGADMYLVRPAQPNAVLYEVRRGLILQRSGRRLPWNWDRVREKPRAAIVERRTQKRDYLTSLPSVMNRL